MLPSKIRVCKAVMQKLLTRSLVYSQRNFYQLGCGLLLEHTLSLAENSKILTCSLLEQSNINTEG